jgi:Glycosyltransferases, probably involved in cell wall biogenesis
MLVSVIIPCYNAERWIDEAIQSALNQTYSPVEVIVVDDGSSDGSWKKIQEFGSRVIAETGPNRGGSAARNRGFVLSRGDYIQFLDADDYLLPKKIPRQVAFLKASGADVVYGDWRHEHFLPDGSSQLEEIAVSGAQGDVLGALLSGWWVAPAALLFRRHVLEKTGGWDESLAAAQDRDLFISIAMTDAKIAYQPGCYAIYRRYGHDTVSTGSRMRWLDNHCRVLDKAAAALNAAGRMKSEYRRALASSYFHLARNYFDRDQKKYRETMEKVLMLEPKFQPRESAIYGLAKRMFGFSAAESLASWKRRLRARYSD